MEDLDRLANLVTETRRHADRCREEISLAETRSDYLKATVRSIDAAMIANNTDLLYRILTNGGKLG